MMQHAFSIDIEDWYQSSYDYNASISDRCVKNTTKVLSFLDHHNITGTFFVQGMVAKAFPNIVKEIDKRGHEVQSHAFSHRPIHSMTPKQFKKELTDTSTIIEDLIGKPVIGFRAPDFSIDKDSWWAFDVMAETGITYDSSIFPLKTSRYGVSGYKTGYSVIHTQSGSIDELTVSVDSLYGGMRLPVGGGGYFRLYPGILLKNVLRRFDTREKPFVIYCHPYEFSPEDWQYIKSYVPIFRKLHQGIGRKGFTNKLSLLFSGNNFGTMQQVLVRCKEGNLGD